MRKSQPPMKVHSENCRLVHRQKFILHVNSETFVDDKHENFFLSEVVFLTCQGSSANLALCPPMIRFEN